MKILLISPKMEHPVGGIAIWTNHYLEGSKDIESFSCDLVNTALVGKRSLLATAKRSIKDEWVRLRRIIKQLKDRLRNGSYDVAHLNTSIGFFGLVRDYYIARKINANGIPVVLHFHCDVPVWVTNRVIKHFLRKILKISKANFVLCETSRRYLLDELNAESVLTPNFVNENLIATSKIIRNYLQKVLFVGRVSVNKGAVEFFKVAKCFPNIDFIMIGEVSDEIVSLEHPDNVILSGIKDHETIISYLDEADVFLFPSHTEGFSLALAEAMARGVPTIATDVGANAEMIENKGGIVVPISDVDAMRIAVAQLTDPKLRREMSIWNINKVRENYETKQVMRLLVQYYNKVLERNIK